MPTPHAPAEREPSATSVTSHTLRLVLNALKMVAFAALRLAAPFVRILLTVLGFLSILIALFYRLVSAPPRSPFWLLFGFGLACGFVLLLYEKLLLFLSQEPAANRH
ncbi:MAG TPA: hypothetical protein VNX02_11305 [Steroidobacteraceae bacterium]|jgi:hypothetical protein|nr:hypothetical protein [Steroidobacteraceae bacterium]